MSPFLFYSRFFWNARAGALIGSKVEARWWQTRFAGPRKIAGWLLLPDMTYCGIEEQQGRFDTTHDEIVHDFIIHERSLNGDSLRTTRYTEPNGDLQPNRFVAPNGALRIICPDRVISVGLERKVLSRPTTPKAYPLAFSDGLAFAE